jgi:hypothetical protein
LFDIRYGAVGNSSPVNLGILLCDLSDILRCWLSEAFRFNFRVIIIGAHGPLLITVAPLLLYWDKTGLRCAPASKMKEEINFVEIPITK